MNPTLHTPQNRGREKYSFVAGNESVACARDLKWRRRYAVYLDLYVGADNPLGLLGGANLWLGPALRCDGRRMADRDHRTLHRFMHRFDDYEHDREKVVNSAAAEHDHH